jgi:superfamily II DNA or RNA helicase
MKARDYQERCCDAILAAAARGVKAMLAVLFTGAGKTVVFSLLARMCGSSKVLIIAPMRELVWQSASTADRITGEFSQVEMSDQWANYRNRVTVASRQTLLSGKTPRYKRFLGTRIVIVDEAHTQYSDAVLDMLREFQEHGAIIIGFTATPFRMDGRKLTDFYEEVAFDYGIEHGIEDEWCLPPRARIVRCSDLDLRQVGVSGGDYTAADLDLILGASRPLHQFCLAIQRERVGSAIAFLPGVRSARALAEMAEKVYGMRAAFICGNQYIQSDDERNLIINRYRQGEIDLLCNCQVATMGFDAPITQTVFLFRPTKSRTLWLQIAGRASRLEPGSVDGKPWCDMSGVLGVAARRTARLGSGKPHFKIVDVTDATAHHSLLTAVDMFAKEGTDQEVIREGRRMAEEGEGDVDDMLAQAADNVRKAKLIESGLASMRGKASGRVHGQDVDLGRKKDISEYRVPLRGRYAGKTMGEVPDDYIQWALKQPSIRGWQRSYFSREQARRRAAGRHS